MRLQRVRLREVSMPLVTPFVTSAGREDVRTVMIVEVHQDDLVGYGEVPVLSGPYYTEETLGTAWHVMGTYLLPLLFRETWNSAVELADLLRPVRRHYMAKAGLEAAVWDLIGKQTGQSLATMIGGVSSRIPAGVSLGIPLHMDGLIEQVGKFLDAGYRRIKVKIQPGWDREPLGELRRVFGNITLSVDANSAYKGMAPNELRWLDEFNLMMIEQPLAQEDLVGHAELQAVLSTPLCLDESIESVEDMKQALHLKSCEVVCIKPSRVGGITEAIRIHDLCGEYGIPVWCGGMLETGIGRTCNLAVASLPNFMMPADLSASSRYFHEDIVTLTVDPDGYIAVPTEPGIGYHICPELLERYTVRQEEWTGADFI